MPQDLKLYVTNRAGIRFHIADVHTVDHGIDLWLRFAGLDAGMSFDSFEIANPETEEILYAGNYVTDEC